MENVAHTLKDLERVVLTWPPSSRTEYAHLRDSMTESLNSMSSHLQMGDERASDDGDEDNECDLSHAFLSNPSPRRMMFLWVFIMTMCVFLSIFRVVSSNVTACGLRRRKC